MKSRLHPCRSLLPAFFCFFSLLFALLLLLVGCRKPASPASEAPAVLAQVEESVITVAQFEAELARRAQRGTGRVQTPAERAALLEEMIRFEVLFARAKAAGLDRDPEMTQRIRRMVVARYEEKHHTEAEQASSPTAAEAEAYYRSHLAEFSQPEKARAALLFFKVSPKTNDEKKLSALRRVEDIRAEALRQAAAQPSFGDLARQHSEDAATRYQGGDAGWVTRGDKTHAWPKEVVDGLFALKAAGEISPVLRTTDGLYLVKLMERLTATAQPFEQVRERIAWKLHHERLERGQKDFYEQQKAGLRITVNRAALEAVKLPVVAVADAAAPTPPARPGP